MDIVAPAAGYFGKIPTHADYILHKMPRAFTEVWEQWAQENLAGFKEAFGDAWVAEYLTMSPYRFILSPGLGGEVIWCGVIFASRDAAGRLFPFTLAMPVSAKAISPISLFDHCQEWLDELEALAIQCLMPDFSKEQLLGGFQEKFTALSANWPSEIPASSSFTQSSLLGRERYTQFGIKTDKLSADLLDQVMSEFCHGYSMWWTQGGDFLLSQGLPNQEMSLAFIDRQWEKHYWLVSAEGTKLRG